MQRISNHASVFCCCFCCLFDFVVLFLWLQRRGITSWALVLVGANRRLWALLLCPSPGLMTPHCCLKHDLRVATSWKLSKCKAITSFTAQLVNKVFFTCSIDHCLFQLQQLQVTQTVCGSLLLHTSHHVLRCAKPVLFDSTICNHKQTLLILIDIASCCLLCNPVFFQRWIWLRALSPDRPLHWEAHSVVLLPGQEHPSECALSLYHHQSAEDDRSVRARPATLALLRGEGQKSGGGLAPSGPGRILLLQRPPEIQPALLLPLLVPLLSLWPGHLLPGPLLPLHLLQPVGPTVSHRAGPQVLRLL